MEPKVQDGGTAHYLTHGSDCASVNPLESQKPVEQKKDNFTPLAVKALKQN